MTIARRHLLQIAALAATLPATTKMSFAQSYPSKPIRFVIGFPAGGPNDILAASSRVAVAKARPAVQRVENKGGRSGNSPPKRWCALPLMATPSSFAGPANAISGSLYPIFRSTSCATWCRSRASPVRRW